MQDGLISSPVQTSRRKVVYLAVFGVVALVGCVLFFSQKDTQPGLQLTEYPAVESYIFDSFRKWAEKFDRKYLTVEEEAYRVRVFADNYVRIKKIMDKGRKFTVGFTKFADLTAAEFRAQYLSARVDTNRVRNTVVLNTTNLPDKIDWRAQGAVTPVKDQGQCGSCWAFSATGSLEGINFIKNQKLVSVSEQQLVDCSWDFGNEGCNGGLMDQAFDYVASKGIEAETSYPYKARDQSCKYDATKVVFKNSGYADVPANDEDQLAAAVAQQPVAVAIEADQDVFQFYTGGILDGDDCGTDLDHGVLAVGYDTTVAEPYWIVKNSWGTGWGESGYVKIAKGSSGGPGVCGIAEMASWAQA